MMRLTLLLMLSGSLQAETLSFTGAKPIEFKNIPPTKYMIQGESLEARVENSASALLLPFEKPRHVQKVSWQWKAEGQTKVRDEAHEASKSGDDALLRIGLLFSGPAPFLPFFAPSWVKAVASEMKLASDRLLYLIVDARHKPQTRWPSPYARSIENVSIPSRSIPESEWKQAVYTADQSMPLVGIWIMADGDDTHSSFKVSLKELRLE